MTYMIRDSLSDAEIKIKDEIDEFRYVFKNGGRTPDGAGRLGIADALATPNAPLMFKRVVTEVLQEAIEPNLIGSRLLSRIDFDGYGAQITFGTVGAISGTLDMAEGQEYPEFSMQVGGGTVTANIGKVGLALKVTEEMIRYSQWDVVGMHLRAAGKAMARHKERKIFNMINNAGVVVFDNQTPNSSEIGRTSGRALDGTGNGSMTVDDLFDMYSSSLQRGFTPNVILCHPLAWAMWVKDPVLREFAINAGGGSWYGGMNLGGLTPNVPDAWKKLGKMQGPTAYDPSQAELEPTQQSAPVIPARFPFGGLAIIPTPEVPYDPVAKTTTIAMIDTSNLGAIVVSEDPMSEEWDDPARDIKKIKMRERYGFVIFNEGLAISLAKNVSVEPNNIVLPPRATIEGISAITRKDP